MNRLQEQYNNEIAPALFKELGLSNVMQIPRITKIVVNIGVGEALDNQGFGCAVNDRPLSPVDSLLSSLPRKLSPNSNCARSQIGVKVTLRGFQDVSFLFADQFSFTVYVTSWYFSGLV